jgi:hypothetical protein
MRFKTNNRVVTMHGLGTVVSIDEGRCIRYAVKLDQNPFNFSPVYYWEDEISSYFYCRSREHGNGSCIKIEQCDFCFSEAINSKQ